MKMTARFIHAYLILAVLLWSCGPDDEAAQKLYSKASKLVMSAQDARGNSYMEAYDKYKKAMEILNRLLKEHGKSETAKKVLENESRIGAYTYSEFRDQVLVKAQKQAQAQEGPFACAVLVADTIKLPTAKEKVMDELISVLAGAGRFDAALKLAESLNIFHRAKAYSILAGKYAEKGKFEDSLKLASEIKVKLFRAIADAAIAKHLAKAGKKSNAVKRLQSASAAVGAIDLPGTRVDVLVLAADGYVAAGEVEEAARVLDSAVNEVKKIKFGYSRWDAITKIAIGYARAGHIDQAFTLAMTVDKKDARAGVFGDMALAHAMEGRHAEAVQAVRQIENPQKRLETLSTLAEHYAQDGILEQATEILKMIASASDVGRVYVSMHRDRALLALAQAYAGVGGHDRGLKMARSIERPEYRAKALARVAGEFALAGKVDDAEYLLVKAQSAANRIQDPKARTDALSDLALEYVKAGRFDIALKRVKDIKKPELRVSSIADIAVKTARLGDIPKSLKVFAKSIDAVKDIDYASGKALALADIGLKYVEAGLEPDKEAQALLFRIVKEFS